ncbi:hypothetical protein K1719_029028 [Acacia pycnantha]|nr:hypothetical protein K1719_029028 [Acacia pycnantha]
MVEGTSNDDLLRTPEAIRSSEEQYVTAVTDNYETTCWGCGLRLLLPSCTSVFKCAWCGAITNQNKQKQENKCIKWRRLRDRCVVPIVITFMLFVIFGGLWALYPYVLSFSLCGITHSIITAILSISTISYFSLAAFKCAGTPPNILWGSYPTVGKGYLENYTYCDYCSKPKPPGTHHCRSCEKCIMDMDHHCPFIGNCVGAANHRDFIAFLISAVVSTLYVSIMSAYASYLIWPSLKYSSLGGLKGITRRDVVWRAMNEITSALLRSVLLLPMRGIVLVYLFFSSFAVQIGLSVLLWQQLSYVYEGKTYLGHLGSQEDTSSKGKKDCQNFARFFGFPYFITRFLQSFRMDRKERTK